MLAREAFDLHGSVESDCAAVTPLTVWVGWSAGKEFTSFQKLAAEYEKQHPDVSLDVVPIGGIPVARQQNGRLQHVRE